MRAADTAARFGGDEFGIVLAPPTDATEAIAVAQRLREAVVAPVEAGGATLRLGASVGIAIYPEHGADADTLISRADAAMYRAKRAQAGPQVFSDGDRTDDDRTRLLGRLADALEGDGLALWFQPQRDVATGEVVGAEALLRWHDEGLWVPPRELVAAAERGGLIRPVTRYVLNRALAQVDRWQTEGWRGLVTVNVTADDLADPAFPGEVHDALTRHGVPPGRLELDVSETGLAIEPARLLEVLARLRDLGVSVAVDDFGAAGVNLALLRALPLSTLKIDRVLLTIGEGEAAPGVVAAATDLGHALGLRVLAEGVETAEALARLEAVGCDLAQGYYLGRPGPAPSSPAEWD
ncbi:MAG: bifunctional diguanylate cyclase/phosphodiesterase [Egibacteraceae bacterium]